MLQIIFPLLIPYGQHMADTYWQLWQLVSHQDLKKEYLHKLHVSSHGKKDQ